MIDSIDWTATTRSGSVYKCIDGRISGGRYQEYYPNATLKAVDRAVLKDQKDPWGYLRELPEVTVPELGKALYIWTFGDAGWRITTEIVKIEFPGVDSEEEV